VNLSVWARSREPWMYRESRDHSLSHVTSTCVVAGRNSHIEIAVCPKTFHI
jgi:hypothetical protein